MRCLVTGASGFVGSHLVRELLQGGHAVTVLLRESSDPWRLGADLGRVHVVNGGIQDLDALALELRQRPIEAAFHLAWSGVSGERRNDIAYLRPNLEGSLKLWELLADSGCRVFLGAGSQAEYGPHAGPLSEAMPLAPTTLYGATKLAAAVLLQQLSRRRGLRFVWLRLFSAYGPADDERNMVPALIFTLLEGGRPALTMGEQQWDYLYVGDAAAAFRAALENGADGIYNLGSGTVCALRQFITAVRDAIDPDLPLGFGDKAYAPDQVMHLQADINLLRAATGWQPTVDLVEGIRRTVDWHRSRLSHAAHH